MQPQHRQPPSTPSLHVLLVPLLLQSERTLNLFTTIKSLDDASINLPKSNNVAIAYSLPLSYPTPSIYATALGTAMAPILNHFKSHHLMMTIYRWSTWEVETNGSRGRLTILSPNPPLLLTLRLCHPNKLFPMHSATIGTLTLLTQCKLKRPESFLDAVATKAQDDNIAT